MIFPKNRKSLNIIDINDTLLSQSFLEICNNVVDDYCFSIWAFEAAYSIGISVPTSINQHPILEKAFPRLSIEDERSAVLIIRLFVVGNIIPKQEFFQFLSDQRPNVSSHACWALHVISLRPNGSRFLFENQMIEPLIICSTSSFTSYSGKIHAASALIRILKEGISQGFISTESVIFSNLITSIPPMLDLQNSEINKSILELLLWTLTLPSLDSTPLKKKLIDQLLSDDISDLLNGIIYSESSLSQITNQILDLISS